MQKLTQVWRRVAQNRLRCEHTGHLQPLQSIDNLQAFKKQEVVDEKGRGIFGPVSNYARQALGALTGGVADEAPATWHSDGVSLSRYVAAG